jgi:hypothetical protein
VETTLVPRSVDIAGQLERLFDDDPFAVAFVTDDVLGVVTGATDTREARVALHAEHPEVSEAAVSVYVRATPWTPPPVAAAV